MIQINIFPIDNKFFDNFIRRLFCAQPATFRIVLDPDMLSG